MPGTLVFILIWLAIAFVAWWISRPSEDERDVLGNTSLGRLLFSFDETRNRAQWSLENENIVRRVRTRSLACALLALAPLPIWIAISAMDDASEPDSLAEFEEELEEDERPANRVAPKKEEEKVLVRTYRRKEGDRGPPEVIEEYRVETLEEKRDPIRLYGTAKVAAKYDVDQLLGITITNIKPGSFWEMVGFRDGDFILEANGELMDDPNTSVAFMNSMHNAPEVIVRVRGVDDIERTLMYNAPKE